MRIFFLLVAGFSVYSTQAQYWWGPKFGGNRSEFVYQSSTYLDSFSVKPSYNIEAGIVGIYQASNMYSVQSELLFEQVKKELRNKDFNEIEAFSRSTNNFLSIPITFRISLGKEPVHYYLSGGPKLRYWLGGNGMIDVPDGDEFVEPPKEYKRLVFNQERSQTAENVYAVPGANRLQFALVAGGGFYLDLVTGGRLQFDVRYTFGHSNMGFDGNPDFTFIDYAESYRYRNNTLSISLAYLFEFDVELQSKGMSTIKESNRSRKTSKNQKSRKN